MIPYNLHETLTKFNSDWCQKFKNDESSEIYNFLYHSTEKIKKWFVQNSSTGFYISIIPFNFTNESLSCLPLNLLVTIYNTRLLICWLHLFARKGLDLSAWNGAGTSMILLGSGRRQVDMRIKKEIQKSQCTTNYFSRKRTITMIREI